MADIPPEMAGYALALLDLDGTLVDSGEAHFVSWIEGFATVGITFTRQHWDALFGRTADDFRDTLMPHGTSEEWERVMTEKRRRFLGKEIERIRLCPGVRKMLATFEEVAITPYVVTSTSRANVEALSARFGLSAPVVYGFEVQHGKPAPDVFLLALERARADGHEGKAFVLEDSPFGIEAGVAAGIDSYGVLTGGFPREVLLAAGALRIFDDAGGMARALRDA